MVLDLFTGLVLAISAGGALGAFSALLGWAASNEPFESKKFAIGLTTGILGGIAVVYLSFGAIKASLTADTSGATTLELMIPIALGILATDQTRAKLSAMVANRFFTNQEPIQPNPPQLNKT